MYIPSTAPDIDERTVQQATKLLLAAAAVIVVLTFASWLPGASWLIPGTPVTIGALITAVATLAVVGLLLVLAQPLATLAQSLLAESPEVASKAGAGTRITTVLVAVLIAHRGLEGAITPLLGDVAWTYDVVFLLLSVPLLAALAIVLYTSLEPTSDLFTRKLLPTDVDDEDGSITR